MVLLQFVWGRGSKCQRIDTTYLLICAVRPYLVSSANFAAILHISKKSSYDFFVRLSILCNYLAFLSASSVEDHSNP